jgi:hypothetical protein
MTEDVVLYRADIRGLKGEPKPGEWSPGGPRTANTPTTNLKVARAFAVYAFGVPRGHERSVYRVELDDPIVGDPEFWSDENASFVMSHWGAVPEVVERERDHDHR